MPKMLKQIFSWRMLILFFMGISSGLPLALTGGTLKAWMTDAGVDLTTIGFFSFVGVPYTLKFLWSPLTDRFSFPGFGRRRGWVLASQVGLIAATAFLAFLNPTTQTVIIAGTAIVIAFFSATQDIALDAYRREILEDEELGFGTSVFINGYLIAMRVSSAVALAMAQFIDWKWIYLIIGSTIVIGIVTVLLAPEPKVLRTPKSLVEAVIAPLKDFFKRKGIWTILAFILLYKIGDTLASEMTLPFLRRGVGFEWLEIATIVKAIGIWAMPLGTLVGGIIIFKIGINRSLWTFGLLQAVSTFGFALLAEIGPDRSLLAGVIVFENLTAGMGTSAYTAFMAKLTNREFTATQYALLSSLMGIPRVILAGPSGAIVDRISVMPEIARITILDAKGVSHDTTGWYWFFTLCALVAIPGVLLLLKVAPWNVKAAK